MAERLRDLQRRFTAHLRDPEGNPPPEGLPEQRLDVYRELLFNNLESFIATSFPVLRSLHDERQWNDLIREFLRRHHADTPLFPRLPLEFVSFLREQPVDPERPFRHELAHYEWLEIEVANAPGPPAAESVDAAGDLLQGRPCLAPAHRLASYRFPVHTIGPEQQPREPPPVPTCLVVFRDPELEVRFLELNPVSARLLERLAGDSGLSGRAQLLAIAEELQHPDPEVVIRGGQEILERMRRAGLVLGTHHP